MIDEIRQKTTDLTKAVDEFLESLKKKEVQITETDRESRKKSKILEEKEKHLKDLKEGLEKERKLIEKEKEAKSEKQEI